MEKKTSTGLLVWTGVMVFGLCIGLRSVETWDTLYATLPRIGFWMIVQNVFVIASVICTGELIAKWFPATKWSVFRLFASHDEKNPQATAGTNIHILPLGVPWIGLVAFILLLLQVPRFAFIEEQLFRVGTACVLGAVVRSLLFGFVHCLVGVPLNVGAAITVAGLWLSYQYSVGGVMHSTAHHATYNAILLALMGIGLLVSHYQYVFLKQDVPAE